MSQTARPSQTVRAHEILAIVWEMNYASDQARSWTEPGSCGIGDDMPCRHANCAKRAANNAGYWATIAARHANLLLSKLAILTTDETPPNHAWECSYCGGRFQLGDPRVGESCQGHACHSIHPAGTPHPTSLAVDVQPPQRIIQSAIERSLESPCRSKRGVVIFRQKNGQPFRVASGFNHKVSSVCDGSDTCKETCRLDAVHAEQHALLRAGLHAQGCDALHVKTVDGLLVPSGGPSCVQCSKLLLAAGVHGVWLYHDTGWRRYDAVEFHRLSLLPVEDTPQGWQPIETAPKDCDLLVYRPGAVPRDRIAVRRPLDWCGPTCCPSSQPTHWMPLPATPEASRRPAEKETT